MTSSASLRFAVAGNPNVGKTSLFNELTGSRYQVANYPGITVESRIGRLRANDASPPIDLLDLPGTYSLTPLSEDEAVAYRELHGRVERSPDAVIVVIDATNLARNLYFLHQIGAMGLPCIVALNMYDVAQKRGDAVTPETLANQLGVPVVATSARTGLGIVELKSAIAQLANALLSGGPIDRLRPELVDLGELGADFSACSVVLAEAEGLGRNRIEWLVLTSACDATALSDASPAEHAALARLRKLSKHTIYRAASSIIAARYARVDTVMSRCAPLHSGRITIPGPSNKSERFDALTTHKFFGPVIFVATMGLLFELLFRGSEPAVELIETGVAALGQLASQLLGPGPFADLIENGVINGAGSVLVFIPQIALLFFFVGLLEDSGYMARAAMLVDRLMAKVGLSGLSFVPLLSGFACAIPAILGTRTIARKRDRLVTILMIPFMSCSARLPIYVLIIGAYFGKAPRIGGFIEVGTLILIGLYALSLVSGLAMGAIYKRTLLRSPTPPFLLELPPYRLPRLGNVARQVADRTLDFVRDAGSIILVSTIILWGLLTFPRVEAGQLVDGETAIEQTYGGRAGKWMEPVLEPIGQDWRVGIGLIGSFAAREVLVSTLGLVYGIEDADSDDAPLRERLRDAKKPDGQPRYGKRNGAALMVFFVFAAQCMSTLAVIKRETRSWRWPVFVFVSMTALAYVAALLTYQIGGLFS